MKLSLVNSESKTDISLPESVFGKDFNEDLVHQAVVTFLAGARQGSHKQKQDLKFEVVERNLIGKKEQEEQEQVLSEVQYGEEVVFLLPQFQEITLRRLIRKCTELLFAQYFQSFIVKKE